MSGHGILKYFLPITHKKQSLEDKDPLEGKELPNLSEPYHRHRDQLPAVTLT